MALSDLGGMLYSAPPRWFKVTFWFPIVGGQITFPNGHVFTIPKSAPAELPGPSFVLRFSFVQHFCSTKKCRLRHWRGPQTSTKGEGSVVGPKQKWTYWQQTNFFGSDANLWVNLKDLISLKQVHGLDWCHIVSSRSWIFILSVVLKVSFFKGLFLSVLFWFDYIMVDCWVLGPRGLGFQSGVPPENPNPFHKGIPGMQTTEAPTHQFTISWLVGQWFPNLRSCFSSSGKPFPRTWHCLERIFIVDGVHPARKPPLV